MSTKGASPTYPGDRNNDPKENNFPSRDLALINQPAGSIEFVNTKDDEMLMISHKNGSFIKFNKFSNDYLNMLDKREHTQGDSFADINGNKVEVIDRDLDQVVYGDILSKIGDVDKWQPYQEKYKNALKELHEIKRLFEIQRTKNHNKIDQSSLQKMSGSFASNPSSEIVNRVLNTVTPTEYELSTKGGPDRKIFRITKDIEEEYKDVAADEGSMGDFTSYGTGRSPSTQDGSWSIEYQKDQITDKRIALQEDLLEIEKELGQNKHPSGGSHIHKISKDFIGIVGLAFNDLESIRKDPYGKLVPAGVKIDPMGTSVYTQYKPSMLVEEVSVDTLAGGKAHLTVGDSLSLIVGSNGIDIKTTGTLEQYASTITTTTENYLLNATADISLGASHVDIAAGIISLRPTKKAILIEDESGEPAMLPLNAKQYTEVDGQVLVDGNLGITGNTINKGGMHIEGNLTFHSQTCPSEFHITETDFEYGEDKQPGGTETCEGGNVENDPRIDGDFPCATKEEPPKMPTHADILPHHLIGYCLVECGDCAGCFPVYSVLAENSVMVHAHHHVYKLPPTKFVESTNEHDITIGDNNTSKNLGVHEAVRSIGSRNNYVEPVLPTKITHDITNFTSLEKFGGGTQINGPCEPVELKNGNWIAEGLGENKNEELPGGMGIRTKETELDKLIEKYQDWNSKIEKMYDELKTKLDTLSQ